MKAKKKEYIKELRKKRAEAERKYQELKKIGYISALDYLQELYESRQINSPDRFSKSFK